MSKFLTGALLGVAVGLLVAPQKGEELRDDLTENVDSLKKRFNKLVGKAGAQLQDLRHSIEGEVEGLDDNLRSRLLTILDEADKNGANEKEGHTHDHSSVSSNN